MERNSINQGPLSTSLSIPSGSRRRLQQAQELDLRVKWTPHHVPFCISFIIHLLFSSYSVKFPIYIHRQNKGNSLSLDIPLALEVSMRSLWKTPFLTACPANWKVVAGRWLLMYLRKQSRDWTVGTKVIDCEIEFPTGGPTESGVWLNTTHTRERIMPNNPYSAEPCTKGECLWLHCENQSICKRLTEKEMKAGCRKAYWRMMLPVGRKQDGKC